MDSPYHELKHLRQSYSNGDIDGDAFERGIRVILKNDGITIRPETKAKLRSQRQKQIP